MKNQAKAHSFTESCEKNHQKNTNKRHLSLAKKTSDDFELNNQVSVNNFSLEPECASTYEADTPLQPELFLPETNPEEPEPSPQFELSHMPKPILAINLDDGRHANFQHSNSLLESLEAQGVDIHYQCREGYCGSCRTTLLKGQVHYTQEPMAWVNEDEILPCCCIPKTDLKIKL